MIAAAGFALVVVLVVQYWWVLAAAGGWWWLCHSIRVARVVAAARRDELQVQRAALAARADRENAWWIAGDPRGTYGEMIAS